MEIVITIKIEGEEPVKIDVKQTETEKASGVSEYARFFDETCPAWTNNAEYNLMYLKAQENYATEKLRVKGHLFLNDVYEMLGMPRTKAGQIVGWIYREKNPIGDNRVDFGLTDKHNSKFVNGVDNYVLLDFNVDGAILDIIYEED